MVLEVTEPMSLTGLKPLGPLILDSNAATNWKTWSRAYKIYTSAAGVRDKPEDVQSSIFRHVAGTET